MTKLPVRSGERARAVSFCLLFVLLILGSQCGPKFKPGELKWSYETEGSIGEASPSIAPDGTVYCGSSDHYLYALTPEGKLKWRFEAGGAVTTTATIADDGTIYFGAETSLYAVNPDSTLKWRYPIASTHGFGVTLTSALALDGTIYFSAADKHLYALKADGSLKWQRSLLDGMLAPVTVGANGLIYVSTVSQTNCMNAVDTDGAIVWSGGTSSACTPAIGSDSTIYAVSDHLRGYDHADHHLKMDVPVGGTNSPVIGSDGTIYFRGWSEVYAAKTEGVVKWQDTTAGDESWYGSTTGAVSSDRVFYQPGKDGCLRAYDSNGVPLWQFQTDGAIKSAPAIDKDGTIFFGSDDGSIYAVQGSGNLTGAPWPVLAHDARRTGRLGAQ